jgi:hypothetical protein
VTFYQVLPEAVASSNVAAGAKNAGQSVQGSLGSGLHAHSKHLDTGFMKKILQEKKM